MRRGRHSKASLGRAATFLCAIGFLVSGNAVGQIAGTIGNKGGGGPVATVDTPVTVDLPESSVGTPTAPAGASPVAPGVSATDVKFYTLSYEVCRLYVSQGQQSIPEECRTHPANYLIDGLGGMSSEAGPWLGQSFKANQTGFIVVVQMHFFYQHSYTWDGVKDGQITLVLYEGAGNTGVELHRQAITPWLQFCMDDYFEDCAFDEAYDGDYWNAPAGSYVLSSPVPVQAGQDYTLYWFHDSSPTFTNAGWLSFSGDAYDEGQIYGGGTPYPPVDATFRVIIQPGE